MPQKPPRGTARGPPQLVLPPPPPYPPPNPEEAEPLSPPRESAGSEASEMRPKRRCCSSPPLCVDCEPLWSHLGEGAASPHFLSLSVGSVPPSWSSFLHAQCSEPRSQGMCPTPMQAESQGSGCHQDGSCPGEASAGTGPFGWRQSQRHLQDTCGLCQSPGRAASKLYRQAFGQTEEVEGEIAW